MQPAIGISAVSLAGVHTRQEAAALASSGERLLGQAPVGKSVLEVAGGADDVFLRHVPKAVDVIMPAGTSQATELDPTLGPVVIQPVPVP
jgi:glucoamylase